jgi:hypothetical protein
MNKIQCNRALKNNFQIIRLLEQMDRSLILNHEIIHLLNIIKKAKKFKEQRGSFGSYEVLIFETYNSLKNKIKHD